MPGRAAWWMALRYWSKASRYGSRARSRRNCWCLRPCRTLLALGRGARRMELNAPEGSCGADEQSLIVGHAEGTVGRDLGSEDLAQHFALRIENLHAIASRDIKISV